MEIRINKIDNAKLWEEIKRFSKAHQVVTRKLVDYNAIRHKIHKKSLTLEEASEIVDVMNQETIRDGFRVTRVKPLTVSDFITK